MGLTDYVVAIPSYKRPDTLKNKTLKVLQRYKIDPARLKSFHTMLLQRKYIASTSKRFSRKNSCRCLGVKNIRNFMPKYFRGTVYFLIA